MSDGSTASGGGDLCRDRRDGVDQRARTRRGRTAGTYRVIAVQQGGTKADTARVTITAPGADAGVGGADAGDGVGGGGGDAAVHGGGEDE